MSVPPDQTSLSQFLAEEVHAAGLESVPGEAVDRVRLLLLDTIGVQVAATSLESSRAFTTAMSTMGGESESTIVGSASKAPAANAALVNGAMVHSLDFDDTHLPAQVHVSSAVMPATFALAERAGSTGEEALTAFICGAEVSIRVGAAAPGVFFDRGFHPTGVCGALGATASAAKVLGLDAGRIAHGLGLAASQASAINSYLDGPGTWVKRMHPGWAAHAGIYAATLASAGVTAPGPALEGRYGLYATHVGDAFDLRLARVPFAHAWETARVGLKPYPTGQYNIPFMHLAHRMLQDAGATPDEVLGIECRVNKQAVSVVCEPIAEKQQPVTGYAAKFSLPYSLAAMLIRGHATLAEFSEHAAISPEIVELARKVTYSVDADADFPRYYPAWIIMTLADGRVIEEREPINLGHPDNPMSERDVLAKFHGCVEGRLSRADADRLAHLVLTIETLDSVAPIMTLLRHPTLDAERRSSA